MKKVACLLASALAAGALLGGCGGEKVIISLEGRKVPLSEVVLEFDRLNGTGQWARVAPEERRGFVEAYAHKELLVREARALYGDQLDEVAEFGYQRYVNRRALRVFTERLQQVPPPSAAEIDSVVELMKQQRRVVDVACKEEADAREIYRRAQAGEDMVAVAEEMSAAKPGKITVSDRGWTSRPLVPPRVGDAIFGLSRLGQVSEPIHHKTIGWMLVRLEEMRGALVDWDKVQREAFVTELKERLVLNRRADALEGRYGFQIIRENLRPLERAFGAHPGGGAGTARPLMPDGQDAEKVPAIQRFTPEELTLPLVTWKDGSWTLGDYIRSLELADPPYWPGTGTGEPMADLVMKRMINWAWTREALASDVMDLPELKADIRRERDRLLIDRYEADHLKRFGSAITDEQVAQYWNEHRREYYKQERVTYDLMRFPAGAKDLAERAYTQVEQGSTWKWVGTEMQSADRRVIFEEAIGPTSGPPYPEVTEVALKHDVLADGSPNVLKPFQVGEDWVLVRVVARGHLEAVDLDLAEPFVRADLERFAMEDSLVGILEDLGRKYGLKIDEKLLATGA